MVVSRRAVVSSMGGMVPLLVLAAAMPRAQEDPLFGAAEDFPEDYVLNLARARAGKPFEEEKVTLPQPLGEITYDQYRDIRFDPSRSIWKDTGSRFTFDLFHTGSLYKTPVDVHVVDGNAQRRVNYLPGLFIFGNSEDLGDPPLGNNREAVKLEISYLFGSKRLFDALHDLAKSHRPLEIV